jgi:outer membrane biosynthesis protein TonB
LRPLPGIDIQPASTGKSPAAAIGAVIAALVVVIAGGAWWFMSGSHSGTDNAARPVTDMVPTPASSATVTEDAAAPATTVVDAPASAPAAAPVAVEAVPVEPAQKAAPVPPPPPAYVVPKPVPPKPKPVPPPPKITFTPVGPQTGVAQQPAPVQAPAAAPGAPSSPEEACGKRVFIAMAMCMTRQCGTPQFASHPQCVQLRKQEQDRKDREALHG